MKHVLAAAIAVLFLAPCPASASLKDGADATPPPERIEIRPDARVKISNINGRIEVRVWDQAAVRLAARYEEKDTRVTFERDGSGVAIEVRPRYRDGRGATADLVVDVPRAARLDVNSVNADIRLATGGELDLSTVNGDAEIDTSGERVSIESVNGDIELRAGDIALRAQTVSGDVEVQAKTITDLSAKSVSGDLEFEAQALGAGSHSVKTHSGDVKLRLPESGSVHIEMKSFGGRRTLGQPGADAKLRVKTFSGDVDLIGPKTSRAPAEPAPAGFEPDGALPPGFVAVF
ncbi:MAG: DUF4097 family beta strand repeat-containing protein [Deltaproteobacteria bacterium]